MVKRVKTTPALRIRFHASEMGRPVCERLGFRSSNDKMVLKLERPVREEDEWENSDIEKWGLR